MSRSGTATATPGVILARRGRLNRAIARGLSRLPSGVDRGLEGWRGRSRGVSERTDAIAEDRLGLPRFGGHTASALPAQERELDLGALQGPQPAVFSEAGPAQRAYPVLPPLAWVGEQGHLVWRDRAVAGGQLAAQSGDQAPGLLP